jgi:hypothetical protein
MELSVRRPVERKKIVWTDTFLVNKDRSVHSLSHATFMAGIKYAHVYAQRKTPKQQRTNKG